MPSYSSDDFAAWLLETIGCNAFLCPYCKAPLDALSMTLDHDIPLHSGGDNEKTNIVFCCADCNNLKGELPSQQYLAFREMLRALGAVVEANILSRLRAGEMGKRLSQQMRAEQAKKAGPKALPKVVPPQKRPAFIGLGIVDKEPF